jgi:hypothetical protein
LEVLEQQTAPRAPLEQRSLQVRWAVRERVLPEVRVASLLEHKVQLPRIRTLQTVVVVASELLAARALVVLAASREQEQLSLRFPLAESHQNSSVAPHSSWAELGVEAEEVVGVMALLEVVAAAAVAAAAWS